VFTLADFIIYIFLGVIFGAAYGATGYLFLTPTVKEPHPARTSVIIGGIGGGTIFTIAALMVNSFPMGIAALGLLCLVCLLLGLRR
jgi:hypothetical protein